MKNYKGYALFSTDPSTESRTKNQATVLANIWEDNLKGNVITVKGGLLLFGYFGKVAQRDKKLVFEKYSAEMLKRGFSKVSIG